MVGCPACGTEVPGAAPDCPHCHLATGLFDAVRDAAGPGGSQDPAYLRTIGELLASVDLSASPEPLPDRPRGLLSRPARFPSLPPGEAMPRAPPEVASVTPITDLPALPGAATAIELKRRIEEYFQIGRRLGLDFTDFEGRSGAAALVNDTPSLEVLAREMFVHIASSVAEEYEATLARRNELAQLVPVPSADVELEAIRRAIAVGDMSGAQRRLVHVRDELGRLEEEWEVGRILVTECDLLVQTLRDLGGDPAPATGPLEEGRKCFGEGRRTDAERLLARAAVALWTLLEPRFFADLKRLRDRLVEMRASGADVAPAVKELKKVAEELRQRNFVGTVIAYRHLRSFVEGISPPEELGPPDLAGTLRSSPPA